MKIAQIKEQKTMQYKGYAFIGGAAVLWGLIGPISSMIFAQGLSPMEVAFWRAALAFFMFGAHAGLAGELKADIKDFPIFILFGILGITVFYGALQYSVKYGGIAMASVLLYTAPAWVAILSRFFFKETITGIKLAAMAITLLGVGAVSVGTGEIQAGFSINPMALGCGLLSGFAYALYYIMGKYFSGKYESPTLFTYMLFVGALGLYPFVNFTEKSLLAWFWLFVLSLVCTYGAYYLYYLGVRHLEPTR
ncbi:MAG: DMT family transporter, partial [Desulfovibrionales bacterium]|nr:DMT family transporter [Desulfovibrionales bacterium]